MITNIIIDRICIIITVIAVLVTALFMGGKNFGITADDSVSLSYEETLFDDSYVHTIDIEISDWDGFLETATSEEYTAVNVTIDGETMKNVALRAKGNTSLSTVSQLGSERYSLKLEFDRYEGSNTYHGLDKLCLNNLIQDYTMMKDYIAYKLMNEFGVASPLVSYTYVTVNGEDWGLFLAVEAVEDSFLERNYGTNYGDLYKPDTMSMGGGRGNGGGFDMREMDFEKMGMKNPFENNDEDSEEGSDTDSSENAFPGDGIPDGGFPGGDFSEGDNARGAPDFAGMNNEENSDESGDKGGFPGGGFGFGNDDAKIKYVDDDTDSYSSIFESAKTTVSPSDQKRLINSIKKLNEGLANADADEIAEAVDVDALMRYMVVHNFVVNGDSYTGSMIHNFYLYEEDGKMTMLPWDYNLAYGTFQADDSSSAVNDPIDNPLSITDGDTDRPMFSWIIACEEYTEMYHEYYQEFLKQFYDSGYLTNLIDTTYNMIHDYVEKDPTKFCETSEFETAVETIKSFVSLRFQSIAGQLDGTIGSTDAEQKENSDTLIDASNITLSDMGSMGGGKGGGPGGGPDGDRGNDSHDGQKKDNSGEKHHRSKDSSSGSSKDSSSESNMTQEEADAANGATGDSSEEFNGMPGDFGGTGNFGGQGEFGGPGNFPGFENQATTDPMNYVYLGGCVLLLIAATIFAAKYKNRR